MADKRSRILLVTRNFPPLVGGMEKLVFELYKELDNHYQIDIIGPKGSQKYVTSEVNIYECPLSPLVWFLIYLQLLSILVVRKSRPDLIIASSGIVAPAVIAAAKLFGKPSLIYLHGLDLVATSRVYKAIFLPAIRNFDSVICNSSNTKRLAIDRSVSPGKLQVINPGVALSNGKPNLLNDSFRNRLGVSEHTKIILSVGRLVPRKGLVEFLRIGFKQILSKEPDCHLVIIGDEAENAIKKSLGYCAQLNAEIEGLDVGNNTSLLGKVSNEVLEEAYRSSDVFILPVIDVRGDVEGFGMVALEAAAHGLPTVAFGVGGVSDAVGVGESGWLIPEGEYDEYCKVVINQLRKGECSITKDNCIRYASNFSWKKFGDQLKSLCDRMIDHQLVDV